MTTVLDLESLEPVAVEARYEVATPAARALEGTARLLVNRTVRGVPVMTRVRLDDPTLPQGIRTVARELAGSTRAKRLVLAIRAESGNAEDFAHAAEQSRRAGLEVALHGEPSAVLGHLRNTHGRLFLVAVSGDLGSAEVRQVASVAQRKGAAVLVGNVSGFGDLEDALALGARYVAGPALESKLRGRLVVAAKASAAERLSAASSLRAAEDEISQVRLALDLDPEARDLATLTRGWAESLVEARVEIESAERSEAQAAAMLVAAERDLGQMLESYAAGNAHRAERLLRCEGSFQEARALEEMARARAEAARRRARALRAGLELRKQALRAALEARAARLEHDAAWVDGFFAADASR
ncbi:MAG: hypothetical protein JNL21_31785 [Myxococcales bacterium]|nr:hypothetical protein [Myxococcales bacterium]